MSSTQRQILNRITDLSNSLDLPITEILDFACRYYSEDMGDYQNKDGDIIFTDISDEALLKMLEGCWHTMLNG